MTNTKSALILHPEYNLYQKKNTAYCSSLQVAEIFGKQHKHVLEDIARIGQPQSRPSSETGNEGESALIENVAGFFKENFIRTTYTNSQNKKQPMYLMTEEGFTLLTMGYSGLKAMSLKVSIIKSFKAMQNFIRDYILAKDEFPIFTQAIADAYENPQPYHYSNEMNMIYRIVLGMDAKQFRTLTASNTAKAFFRSSLKLSTGRCVSYRRRIFGFCTKELNITTEKTHSRLRHWQ